MNMRALQLLSRYLQSLLQSIHQDRLTTIYWAVNSLLLGGKLALTAIGRSVNSKVSPKHNIKRMDRFLGNKLVHQELDMLFGAAISLLVGSKKRPIILVDWTPAGRRHHALVAAVPVDGRALPIYLEVHSEKKHGNPTVARQFLKKLQILLNSDCKPIIVTDAGFKNNWFKQIASWGWDYVGRVRGKVFASNLEKPGWISARLLYEKACAKPHDLGGWILSRATPVCLRLVIFRRLRKRKTIRGQSRQRKARQRAIEPWLLATTLKSESAQKIVSIYAKRMQIEETFRDTKSHRYGWSFCVARSNSSERIRTLLLIATFGIIAVSLLGQAAENVGFHQKYQANTIRCRRVLSLFVLGWQIALRGDDKEFSYIELRQSLDDLRRKTTDDSRSNVPNLKGIP
jgi:hypothetical protein